MPQWLVFLGRRLGIYTGTAVLAVVMNFMLPRLMPGDPVQDMFLRIQQATGAPPPQYLIDNIYALYGDPNRPLPLQFVDYLTQLARGDLGRSVMQYPTPVSELLAQTLPWTLGLGLITLVLAWLIGTLLGAWLGWKPSGMADKAFTPVLMFFHSIPAFWLAIMAAWFFAYRNYYFPAQGGYDAEQRNHSWANGPFLTSVVTHGTLPALVLVIVGFAGWLFSMRNMTIATTSEDYVTLARAKGLSRWVVLMRYAARNAILPNVTGLAQAVGGLLGSIVLVESVFVYPGMGNLLGNAIGQRDYPVMQAILLMTVFLTLAANFIADSIYVLLDPRTREGDA
ncbi:MULTISPECIES: ABC transporter permease [Aestuariimicrobium]|uniref:ABC transporter permease n=1 Tax=Aestuariimicrobium TaxID=396388 RepID=UPI0003B4A248|nr:MULTISPECIES: ABC transporter permease [Aestuariimicrobium]CAI9399344.1 Dipeptide transport system permease protein DppB [Aestuariimicrobium sp. T2.26MG-19.2B]